MKKLYLLFTASMAVLTLFAQPRPGYYAATKGAKGYALKTAFHKIVGSHKDRGYNALWTAYKTTDRRPDGKVWDIYSNATNYDHDHDRGGNYKREGDCFNREHTVPQSWFNKENPMRNDVFHIYPSDAYVNNRRGNLPFGEVGNITYQSKNGFSKVGDSNTPGYSGKVFEPNDEFKGDLARTYFYMATAYENRIASWDSPMMSNNRNSGYKEWAIRLLLKWAKEDPVSQKEIDRNNAAEKFQGNRNPYIDFPGLEQYIWGEHKDMAFDPDNYQNPTGIFLPEDKPKTHVDVYNLSGQAVRRRYPAEHLNRLPSGLYIVDGKKVLVK